MNFETKRRDFIKTLAAATAGAQFMGLVSRKAHAGTLPSQMNLMLIMTDQERPPMWFPAGWEEANLPNTVRLKNHGLSFTHAFCATAMCTPSRVSLFTGLFPAQNHSPWTLTEDYLQTPTEPQLDPSLPNLATCLKEAGYDVIYKGKWHMSHGTHGPDGEWVEDDISRYGFDGWNPPDGGGDTRIENFGGGNADHDGRCIADAKAFLEDRIVNPTGRPFCLIVSLINPHDVLAYPGPSDSEMPPYLAGGYDETWLNPTTPPISLPPTIDEHLLLNHKPTAHANIKLVMAASLGPIATETEQQNYLNFYGNLMKEVDRQIGELLDVFDQQGAAGEAALNQTLIIRTSDHGENGLCHGGLRQKAFVAYDETLRVPLIWSNPVLFPTARTTDALVSHVDLLPTICSLVGVPDWQSKGFAGIDYSSVILDEEAADPQDYILFTFDDIYASGNAADVPDGTVAPPNCLRVIRTKEFKYVRYFDPKGVEDDQEEFYDLRPTGGDYDATYQLPLELKNLSQWAENQRAIPIATPEQEGHRAALKYQLSTLETTRLAPRPYTPSVGPDKVNIEIKRWEEGGVPQAAVQLSFYSRHNTTYQLQKSLDLVNWSDTGSSVPGNGGLILLSDSMDSDKAFYRVRWQQSE